MRIEKESQEKVGVEEESHEFSARNSATSSEVTVCFPETRVKPERVFDDADLVVGSDLCFRSRRRLMALLMEMSSSRAKDLARR